MEIYHREIMAYIFMNNRISLNQKENQVMSKDN